MTQEAKNLYNAFHSAMGHLDAPPFERVSVREQEAWNEAARQNDSVRRLQDQLHGAQHEISNLYGKIRALELELAAPKPCKKRAPVPK